MKGNKRYEEIHGNCDPPDTTIHKEKTKSNDIKISQRRFKCYNINTLYSNILCSNFTKSFEEN